MLGVRGSIHEGARCPREAEGRGLGGPTTLRAACAAAACLLAQVFLAGSHGFRTGTPWAGHTDPSALSLRPAPQQGVSPMEGPLLQRGLCSLTPEVRLRVLYCQESWESVHGFPGEMGSRGSLASGWGTCAPGLSQMPLRVMSAALLGQPGEGREARTPAHHAHETPSSASLYLPTL